MRRYVRPQTSNEARPQGEKGLPAFTPIVEPPKPKKPKHRVSKKRAMRQWSDHQRMKRLLLRKIDERDEKILRLEKTIEEITAREHGLQARMDALIVQLRNRGD